MQTYSNVHKVNDIIDNLTSLSKSSIFSLHPPDMGNRTTKIWKFACMLLGRFLGLSLLY